MEENETYTTLETHIPETVAFIESDTVKIKNNIDINIIRISFNKEQRKTILNNSKNNDFLNLFIYKMKGKNVLFLIENYLDFNKNKNLVYKTNISIVKEKFEKIKPYKGENDEYVNLTLFPNNYKQKSLDNDYNIIYDKKIIGKAINTVNIHSYIKKGNEVEEPNKKNIFHIRLNTDFVGYKKEFFINENSTKKTVYITDKPTQHTSIVFNITNENIHELSQKNPIYNTNEILVSAFPSKKEKYILINYKKDGKAETIGKGKITTLEEYKQEYKKNQNKRNKPENNQKIIIETTTKKEKVKKIKL